MAARVPCPTMMRAMPGDAGDASDANAAGDAACPCKDTARQAMQASNAKQNAVDVPEFGMVDRVR